jgi:rod shape determining protein RodA
VGACLLISAVNYQALLDRIHWFYIAAVASLMAVLIFGQKYLGARRWIKMPGGNHFQPSEWVKLILILSVAKYFADLRHRELSWPDFMKAGAIVGIPMLMVLAQPDLGTALTYIPIAVMGVFLGGMQWKQGVVVVLLAAIAWERCSSFRGCTFSSHTRSSGSPALWIRKMIPGDGVPS